jgi:CheY-like chemotaxis protein
VDNPCDLSILLVEDDPNDVLLMQRALERNGINTPVHVVSDGEEALDYLRHMGRFEDRVLFPFPGVILMDLKMPKTSGLEVLRWMHENSRCTSVPTIVFSASRIDSDVEEAYRLGATSYFVKPTEFHQLLDLIRILHEYWKRAERPVPLPDC